MNALHAWARDLVVIVALAAILEMALPQGDFRRFARLVMGLLVLIAMVKPLLGYLQVAVALPGGELRAVRSAEGGYTFVGDSSLFGTAAGAYQAQMRDQVARLVSASLGLDLASVSVDVDLESGSGWPGPPRRIRVRVYRVPERLVSAWVEQGGAAAPADTSSARSSALAAIGDALRTQLAGLYRLDRTAVEVSMPR